MCTQMYKSKTLVVESGRATLNKFKPITLCTLTETKPGEFALVFSVSHAVADGRTYYEIFKMLAPGATVRALKTTRVMSFSEEMRDKCGRAALEWIDRPSTLIVMMAYMAFNPKAKCFAFELDEARVAQAKAEGAAEGGVPYVTTNDVLTCGFFNACGTRIDDGPRLPWPFGRH